MTTKLWITLALGVLAVALAIGAAPIADAVESAPAPASATQQSTAAEPVMPSPSTPVSGILTDPQGHPLAHVELHIQGQINHDIYTVRTGAGGSFSIALPPGTYNLRGEHGAIIVAGVRVGQRAVSLGSVQTPAPLAPTRLFDRQAIGEAIVSSPAPASARPGPTGEPLAPVAATPALHRAVSGAAGGKRMAPAQVAPINPPAVAAGR